MQDNIDERIARLLDQLENRHLTVGEIKKIEDKVAILESLKK